MKKLILIPLIIVLAVSFIFAGCGKETPAPAPAPAPAPTPAPAPITLKIADFTQVGQLENVMLKWWGDELMKRTNNAVKCEYYFNETLAKQKELLDAVSTGMADVAIVYGCFHQQQVPIIFVHRTPGMPTTDHYTACWAYDQLLKEDATVAELKRTNLVGLFGFGHTGDYIFSSKPVKSLADFTGLKFASSGLYSSAFKAWGGEVVEIASPEIYEGMKRGMIDACNKPLAQMLTMNMYEVSPYLAVPKIGFTMLAATMNMDTWNNKLTPEIRNVITNLNLELPKKAAEIGAQDDVKFMEQIKAKNVTISTLPEADLAKATEMVQFLWDQWADDLNSRGLPGTDLKNKYLGWLTQGPPK